MVTDHDRHGHGLILRLVHLVVGPRMTRIEKNAGFLRPLHLQAMKAQVALPGFRILGDHESGPDERAAVADSRLMNRHRRNVDFIVQHDFLLDRPGFHEARFTKLFGAADKLRNHFIARSAKRHGRERDVARRLPQAAPARIARQIFK